MKKDTIYIDVEDDITAIIDKVKASSSKIVALVPPKRSAVLQSVVNMKLLKRTAGDLKKQVVLITNEPTAISLAGGVGMYTAKNLQSKPEIPEAPQDLNIDEAVIDGNEVELAPDEAIGDLDDEHKGKPKSDSSSSKSSSSNNKDKKSKDKKEDEPKTKEEKKAEKKNKIPDFSKFRTKLMLGIGILFGLLVLWYLFFVRFPSATIIIKAQTSKINTNIQFTADTTLKENNIDEAMLKAKREEVQKTATESFAATGEKNVGKTASGEVTIRNCDSSSSVVIAAGSTLVSSGGLSFKLDKAVTVPGGSFSGGGCSKPGEADGDVTATEAGDQYNLGDGTKYSVSGVSSLITAVGGQMSGGTTENVKVVSQSDVDAAKEKMLAADQTEGKLELEAEFGDDMIPLEASLTVEPGAVSSTPAVGEQADNGQITIQFNYSMIAVETEAMTELLENYQKSQIDESTQSIYENGLLSASYSLDQKNSVNSMVFTVITDGYVGPTIDTTTLAEEVSGKKYGEVVDIVQKRPGVNEVDVKFSPFYVNKAPNASRINIELEVSEDTLQ